MFGAEADPVRNKGNSLGSSSNDCSGSTKPSSMMRKPLELPSDIAHGFVKDMKAYFAEDDRFKRDEIALTQLHVRREHQGPREKTLELSDVKAMSLHLRNRT